MPLDKNMSWWEMYKELKADNKKKWKERWQWWKPRTEKQIKAIIASIKSK